MRSSQQSDCCLHIQQQKSQKQYSTHLMQSPPVQIHTSPIISHILQTRWQTSPVPTPRPIKLISGYQRWLLSDIWSWQGSLWLLTLYQDNETVPLSSICGPALVLLHTLQTHNPLGTVDNNPTQSMTMLNNVQRFQCTAHYTFRYTDLEMN